MPTATLYHVTPRRNLKSIQASGIEPRQAAGRVHCAVWLAAKNLLAWAVGHTQTRHKVALEEVVVLEVRVQRRDLVRHQRGFWRTHKAVEPERIVRVIDAADLFESPVTDGE